MKKLLAVLLAAFMVLIGILMQYGHLSFSPFILGFILGPMMEKYMRQAMTYSDAGFMVFFTRPVSAALLIIAVLFLFWPYIRDRRAAKRAQNGNLTDVEKMELEAGKYNVRED